jgi:hypothetical protein
VVVGLALLVVGLVAYATVPAVHTTPVVNEQNVWVQDMFPVQAGSLVEQPKSINVSSGMNNELRLNVTVSKPGAGPSSIHFELLAMNNSQSCSPSPHPPTILVDQTISNKSFNIPLNVTGTYCFVFDNQGPQPLKNINISARAVGTTQNVTIARDGTANTAGLGLGALGLVVTLYGYSRKTIIPWE